MTLSTAVLCSPRIFIWLLLFWWQHKPQLLTSRFYKLPPRPQIRRCRAALRPFKRGVQRAWRRSAVSEFTQRRELRTFNGEFKRASNRSLRSESRWGHCTLNGGRIQWISLFKKIWSFFWFIAHMTTTCNIYYFYIFFTRQKKLVIEQHSIRTVTQGGQKRGHQTALVSMSERVSMTDPFGSHWDIWLPGRPW